MILFRPAAVIAALLALIAAAPTAVADDRMNVLFIISDDLTATALSCYGNPVCKTPNIDRLAAQGVRFSRAYCQATFCGPSRASFLSGYYPHASKVFGYVSGRQAIGDARATWPQHFKNAGYHTARVGKIFHMGVPGDVEKGVDSADDPASWSEKHNCQGPEWKAPGAGETLEGNPDGKKPVVGGNTFVVVAADGDDLVHADGKAAAKAVELIDDFKGRADPFFLAVGFVRPHVPFVAPKKYFDLYPWETIELPPGAESDQDDIPKAGINYKTGANMKFDDVRRRKSIAGYYAAVSFMDAQVGKVLDALERSGKADRTIVIFTSDHGYHLGEHDFWAKVSLHEESAAVPLIIRKPGGKPGVSRSLVGLIDLYPTVSRLCGLEVPTRIQGLDLGPVLDDPARTVRDAAFSINGPDFHNGLLLREDRWAYIQYGEDARDGVELYDMEADPGQHRNLAVEPGRREQLEAFRQKVADRLREVRACDLHPR
ncbi:sulfatase [Paludisphaera rhizosphaerae]|uniref:sulfatase n=1 Tax=Paludisphaera rhizosphaerae TaxID=2711216 RepID=UPI0013E9C737|nr:sulfatase [Paludisphaera rhizosphaerae]